MAKDTGKKVNVRVKLNNVRASYLHVFKKHAFEDNEPKYSGTFYSDPDSKEYKANVQAMNDAIDDVIDGVFGGKEPKEIYCDPFKGEDEFKGMMGFKATNHNRPKVLDQHRQPLHEDDGKPYSGCYVNVIVDVYGSPKYKSVQATLMGVQFLRDGTPLSGGYLDDEEFDEVDDDEQDGGSSRRGSRGRDDSDDRGRSGRGRDRDDDRGRDRDDDRRSSRSRGRDDDSRDEDPPRRSSRDRDDEPRGRGRDREEPRGRGRDRDEEPRGRDSGKSRRRDFGEEED